MGTRVLVPPGHIAAGKEIGLVAERAQSAAPGLLGAFPDQAERRAPDPDEITCRNLVLGSLTEASFFFRLVGRGLVNDDTAREDARAVFILVDDIFHQNGRLLLVEIGLPVAFLILVNHCALEGKRLDVGCESLRDACVDQIAGASLLVMKGDTDKASAFREIMRAPGQPTRLVVERNGKIPRPSRDALAARIVAFNRAPAKKLERNRI